MHGYSFTRLTDCQVTRSLSNEVARERGATARVLALIAEADARGLYLPAGHPSMYHYCVHELGYSENAAFKRIQAARAARRFPALLAAVAEKGLHLTGVGLLAPHLTEGNAGELIEAAAGRTKSGIEELLARRFPRTELLPLIEAVPAAGDCELAPAQAGPDRDRADADSGSSLAPAQVGRAAPVATGDSGNPLAPAQVEACNPLDCTAPVSPRSIARVQPVAPQRYAIHLTISGATHEKLRRTQALLAHSLPSGDIATVLDLALDGLVEKLEKRRFAKTSNPRSRPPRSAGTHPRHIPAHVKRAVWQRDGGRCTFVGDNGRRCNAVRFLQFDDVAPVARGGGADAANLRLRCRAHNQLEAERAFGADFMRAKREWSARDRGPVHAPARFVSGPARATGELPALGRVTA